MQHIIYSYIATYIADAKFCWNPQAIFEFQVSLKFVPHLILVIFALHKNA